jgi:predicted nucleic acid-binding protein
MATFLLDTSVIIDVINGKRGRRQFLYDLLEQGNTLGCCPINLTEVYAGLRSGKGKTLNLGDVFIAATAIHNSLILLTDNVKDFPMKELSLYPLPN